MVKGMVLGLFGISDCSGTKEEGSGECSFVACIQGGMACLSQVSQKVRV